MLQDDDVQVVESLANAYQSITTEVGKVIVGQQQVIEELLVSLFARGHCLLVGVPGLAKTLLIRSLADSLALDFSRIQFTPDLMPSDITGTEVIQEDRSTGTRDFRFLSGPIFGNVILADEINRTPPKTQAALLEAMQEHQVTVGGRKHALAEPFFVLATQNPIEQEGTYPLPEAQLDRFMFNVLVDYPEEEEEFEIVRRTTADTEHKISKTLTAEEIINLQGIIRKVPVADHVIRYALAICRLTRPDKGEVPEFIRDYLRWGAGPRASQYLILGAKARAVLHGRFHAGCQDVKAVAKPVLRHRLIMHFNAEAEGIKPDDIVDRLIDVIPTTNPKRPAVENYQKYLNPQTLDKLRGLELRARSIVEGYVAGVHKSPYHGFSVEFAEHREYVPGDDLRYVDWKVFGRTDKFYLKQYEDETNLISYLLVDTSESMKYRGPDAAMSKLEYAKCAAAALAYLILQQQDSVGLVTFDSAIRALIKASSSASHFSQVVHVLEAAEAAEKTATGPIFHDLAERLKKRGVVVVFSDLFDDVPALMTGLKHFRHRRHEVILFHVLDPAELDFPFQHTTQFKGLEQLPHVVTDPRSLRKAYLEEFTHFLSEVRRGCREHRIDYVQLRTDRPLDVALSSYLARRMAQTK